MASGTIALTRTGSGYLTGQILWSSVSNGTAANTSTVTAQLQIQRSALNSTTGTFTGTFTVGGVSENISWYGTLPTYEWVTVKEITASVSHNADGNGSCYLYAIVNGPTGTTMEGTSVSGSATVNMEWIPRYASIKSVKDFTDEEDPVITYANPAGNGVEDLQIWISLDGSAVLTSRHPSKTGSSYTFVLTDSERTALRKAAADTNSLQLWFFARTTIGGAVYNVSKTAAMRIVNATPAMSPAVVDTNSATTKLTGNSTILVANHSTARVSINASAKKYATITSQKVEHGAKTLTGDGNLSPVTNHSIKFIVTDSRGNTTTQYASNTIVPYINPTCVIGNSIPEADGTFTLEATGLFYNGSIGATANTLSVQYRYKAVGGSYGSWASFGSVSKDGNSYRAAESLTGLDYQTAYTFQVRVMDAIHTSGITSAEKTVISEPVFHWGQNDFSFNVPVNLKSGCDILKDGTAAYAPAGYGLGSGGITHTSLGLSAATMTRGGFYRWDSNSSGAYPFSYGTMLVSPRTVDTSGYQLTFGHSGTYAGIIAGRQYTSSTSNAWDYLNPPMVAGTAYRTLERWNKKAVYQKLINLGTMQASGLKNHAIGITVEDGATPISLEVYVTDGTFVYDLMSDSFSAGSAYLWSNGAQWYVNVTCASSMSAYTGKAIVKWVYN